MYRSHDHAKRSDCRGEHNSIGIAILLDRRAQDTLRRIQQNYFRKPQRAAIGDRRIALDH